MSYFTIKYEISGNNDKFKKILTGKMFFSQPKIIYKKYIIIIIIKKWSSSYTCQTPHALSTEVREDFVVS